MNVIFFVNRLKFVVDEVIQVAAVHCKTWTVLLLQSKHTESSVLAGSDRLSLSSPLKTLKRERKGENKYLEK